VLIGPDRVEEGEPMASTSRYRVYLEDGSDLDDYVASAGTVWRAGDTLYAGGLPAYRVVEVIPLADANGYDGIFMVQRL
jgi:hypothetical protein